MFFVVPILRLLLLLLMVRIIQTGGKFGIPFVLLFLLIVDHGTQRARSAFVFEHPSHRSPTFQSPRTVGGGFGMLRRRMEVVVMALQMFPVVLGAGR